MHKLMLTDRDSSTQKLRQEGHPVVHSNTLSQKTNKGRHGSVRALAWHVRTGVVVQACHPSTRNVGTGGLRVRGHPWLHTKFSAGQGYMMLSYIKI